MEMKTAQTTSQPDSDPESIQQSIVETVNQIVAKSEQEMMNLGGMQDDISLIDSECYPNRMIRTKLVAISRPVYSKLIEGKGWDTSSNDDHSLIYYRKHRRKYRKWQDEHEYKEQMNLLNADWEKPEVNEVIREMLEKQLPCIEAAKRITIILGREVTVSSVRNRAFHYANLQSKTFPTQCKPEISEGNLQNTMRKHSSGIKEFGPGLYEVIRNIRGNLNSIAIKEPGSDYVRIYRRSTTRFYYSYYRCSSCDHLSKYEIRNVFAPPIIKMVRDRIVCEPFPPHHPNCQALPLKHLRTMQIDREKRQQIIDELQPPFEAWSKGELKGLLEEASKVSQHSSPDKNKEEMECGLGHIRERKLCLGKPVGETLASYEEKIRKRLNAPWRRSDFRASSVDSERSGSQTPAYNDEWLLKRQEYSDNEMQPILSNMSDELDEDGLLPEEREQVELLIAQGARAPITRKGKVGSSVPRNVSESGDSRAGTSRMTSDIQPPITKARIDPYATIASASYSKSGVPKASSDSERSKYQTVRSVSAEPVLIRDTKRKLFMVDDEHLLKLFRRCPNCGGNLKTLVLSSQESVPVVKYKCHADCEDDLWLGYEPK